MEKLPQVKVLTAHSVADLNNKISELLKQGWEVVGGHQVVIKHTQNRFAGLQHKDTINELEYSITVKKLA
jgi:Domain of unknown function (DUF1737)